MLVRIAVNRAIVVRYQNSDDFNTEPSLSRALRIGGRLPVSKAQSIVSELKANGIDAYTSWDNGERADASDSGAETPAAAAEEVEYRGVRPFKQPGGLWSIRWVYGDQTLEILGKTPTEALQKLFDPQLISLSPAQAAFVDMLEAAEQPAVAAAAPVTADNGRILRPGSQTFNPSDLPERRVSDTRAANTEAEYKFFANASSVLQLKERFKTDPEFATWYNGASAIESNAR